MLKRMISMMCVRLGHLLYNFSQNRVGFPRPNASQTTSVSRCFWVRNYEIFLLNT